MEKGLASVLIPVFNGSKYLLEFLNSLKEQDYKKIQLVIRDDGSTDDSVGICKKWKDKNQSHFSSILFEYNGKNLGLSGNISKMAEMAEGEFIFLADQDDVWLKNKISYQVQYMQEHKKCVVSLSDRSIANENMHIFEESNYLYAGYKIQVMDFLEVIKHRGVYAANTMCIRNNGYNIFNIPKKLVMHDTFLAIMASYYGSVDFIFEPLLLYRVHKNNLSGNYAAQFSSNFFECFFRYYKASKREVLCNTYDDQIIKDELMKRFNIRLEDYQNCFKGVRERSRIVIAWKRTNKDFHAGKIGIWR